MASKWVSRAVTASVLMMAGLGSVQAAEKVRWEHLQERVRLLGESRSVTVITRDGSRHSAQRMEISFSEIALFDDSKMAAVPRQDVARIEVRQRKRYYRHISENLAASILIPAFSCGGDPFDLNPAICALGIAISPPLWAYTAASAPAFIAADGVAFLKPAKIFEIVD